MIRLYSTKIHLRSRIPSLPSILFQSHARPFSNAPSIPSSSTPPLATIPFPSHLTHPPPIPEELALLSSSHFCHLIAASLPPPPDLVHSFFNAVHSLPIPIFVPTIPTSLTFPYFYSIIIGTVI